MPTNLSYLKLKENLNKLMNDRSLRVSDLSKETSLPETTIRYIMQGLTDNPRLETLVILAEHFQISIDELVGLKIMGDDGKGKMVVKTAIQSGPRCQQIPILEWDEVKSWKNLKMAFDMTRDFVMCDRGGDRNCFALRVKYEGKGVFPKDSLIIVDPQHLHSVDNYVIVSMRKNRPTIRQIWEEGGILYLNAVGGNVPSEMVHDEHIIFGTVVECRIGYK